MRVPIIKALNEHVSLADLLEYAGIDIPYNGQIYCPFHVNVATKAAKFYPDTNSIWCFSEQRRYGSYDMMRKLGWDNERILSHLPADISLQAYSQDTEHKIKFPLVPASLLDKLESQEIDLPTYLAQLQRYWVHRDKLQQEEF